LAGIALLDLAVFFTAGLRCGRLSGPYVEVHGPFKASPAPTLPRALSGKIGHPIEPIRELKQFLSDFRDPGLPR
jgi:hypothetical protein